VYRLKQSAEEFRAGSACADMIFGCCWQAGDDQLAVLPRRRMIFRHGSLRLTLSRDRDAGSDIAAVHLKKIQSAAKSSRRAASATCSDVLLLQESPTAARAGESRT
jgi:hypothetical protein